VLVACERHTGVCENPRLEIQFNNEIRCNINFELLPNMCKAACVIHAY
jgi:hypothetical protein